MQLSIFGQGSPFRGVVVGPLRVTWILLDLGQDVVRDGLHVGDPVLDGQALDVPDLDLARLDLVLQHEFEDPLGFGGDERPDAVARQDADTDRLDLPVIDPVRHGFDLLHALHLDLEELAEVLLRPLDGDLVHERASLMRFY